MTYAERFLKDRKNLIERYPEWKIEVDGKIITLNSPELLAGFAGYLKFQIKRVTTEAKVYFRGELNDHVSAIPSLYRFNNLSDFNDQNIQKRTDAYNDLINELPGLFKAKRFAEENPPCILQHYGIKTNWIDLVDNLFVALWFSNYRAAPKNDYTYIKFFSTDANGSGLQIEDLRESHSSLSLRPHCQHAISVTRSIKNWNVNNCDFSTNVIAIAKIPNNRDFKIESHIFSHEYMFPKEQVDNTLKLLRTDKFKKLLEEITEKHDLKADELGQIK